MLKVIRAGMQTTVQDMGRTGYRLDGVSRSGALDMPSLMIANVLVGNAPEAAALEITLGKCQFEFTRDVWFALSGADCEATLDGKPVWTGWRQRARVGQQLQLNLPRRGMRSYLAVAGGLDVPVVMGSRSTDLKGGFGGFLGRELRDGDEISALAGRDFTNACGVKQLLWSNRIRALPGPEYHELSREAQENFWRLPWQLSAQSNRMGYRLHGQTLARAEQRELTSHGLLPGVVQVPHNGQPIVLMNDAQTTGGYPRIACIIAADLHSLAQVRLGEPIHFVQCSLEDALKVRREQQVYLNQLAWQLNGEHGV